VVPSTKGWQSVRFSTYPQELIFELADGEAKITKIQVLSHQSKIAKKIDIYIGLGTHHTTAKFKRLGYLTLDSNERSSFQARELKTVFVDQNGKYIKFLIHEHHENKQNVFRQVGIVAVSFLGEINNETNNNLLNHPLSNNQYKLGDDAKKISYRSPYNDITVDLALDPQTANKLRQLAEAKSRAIANEDYVTAKQIKLVEQELKALGSKLAQLDMAKSEAVAAEEYDLAKEIKDETDDLRKEIERKVSICLP
jgi:centrosomal protein CEP104